MQPNDLPHKNADTAGDKLLKPATVSSETLLGRAQELRIVHEGREYRLRRTQNGRLILTA